MSRPPRVLSKTGLYHIIFRGICRQNLFEEENDYKKILEVIRETKEEMDFKVHAYCLITNHVHLFIGEKNSGDIKKIMHKILTKYVVWYNYKYERSGALIGNRYKSEPIEDEVYYLTLMRYIHQNPLKAGMVSELAEYRWSSYIEYIGKKADTIADTEEFLHLLSDDEKKARKEFIEYHKEIENTDFFISETKRLTDEQLRRRMKSITDVECSEIGKLAKKDRDMEISKLREKGFTIGQIERLTGISRGIITRAR